jgi:hypothetical protein
VAVDELAEHADDAGDPLLRLTAAHPAVAIAVGSAALVVTKLVLVARLDTTTALALAMAAGPANIVLGVAIQLWPLLLVVLAIGLGWWLVRVAARGQATWLSLLVVALVLLATVSFLPLVLLVPAILLIGADAFYVSRTRRAGKEPEAPIDTFGRFLYAIAAAGLITTGGLWLPKEILTIGHQTYVGYVVAEQGTWVSVLRDEDRLLLWVRSEDVHSRQLCSGDSYLLSLADVAEATPRPPLPECPEPGR